MFSGGAGVVGADSASSIVEFFLDMLIPSKELMTSFIASRRGDGVIARLRSDGAGDLLVRQCSS